MFWGNVAAASEEQCSAAVISPKDDCILNMRSNASSSVSAVDAGDSKGTANRTILLLVVSSGCCNCGVTVLEFLVFFAAGRSFMVVRSHGGVW